MLPLKSVPRDHEVKTISQSGPQKLLPFPSTTPSDTPSSSDASSSLYPLLTTSGDAEFKLPPLHIHRRRSPSPASSSDVPSRSPTSSPEPVHTTLPGIKSLTSTDRLAHQVGKIDIEREQSMESTEEEDARSEMDWEDDSDEEESKRREHAKLIKDLLLLINSEYRKQHGTPKTGMLNDSRSATPVPSSKSNIVMDIAAKVSPATRMLMGPGVPGVQKSFAGADVEMTNA